MGVQSSARSTRFAKRKLRKSAARSRSWRKRRWKRPRGSVFHAIVSVMAVKIQFSSPSGVLRSFSRPGTLSPKCAGTPPMLIWFWLMKRRSAMRIGVVRQHVKMSAGCCGLIGSSSFGPQDASTMDSSGPSASWLKYGMSAPALLQSKTKTVGAPVQL